MPLYSIFCSRSWDWFDNIRLRFFSSKVPNDCTQEKIIKYGFDVSAFSEEILNSERKAKYINTNKYWKNVWHSPLNRDLVLMTMDRFDCNSQIYILSHCASHGAINIYNEDKSLLGKKVFAIDDGVILDIKTESSTKMNAARIYIKHKDINNNEFIVIYAYVKTKTKKEDLKTSNKANVVTGQEIGIITSY